MTRTEINLTTGETKVYRLTAAEIADAKARTEAERAANEAAAVQAARAARRAALLESLLDKMEAESSGR